MVLEATLFFLMQFTRAAIEGITNDVDTDFRLNKDWSQAPFQGRLFVIPEGILEVLASIHLTEKSALSKMGKTLASQR